MDVRTALIADPSAAAQARSVTRRALAAWDLTPLSETACLLVSELVSNVVRHGAWPCELTISCRDDHVHFAVSDHDPRLPMRRHPEAPDLSGRGLALVEDLAESWGCESAHADAARPDAPAVAKTVWFDLIAVRQPGHGREMPSSPTSASGWRDERHEDVMNPQEASARSAAPGPRGASALARDWSPERRRRTRWGLCDAHMVVPL